MARLELNDAEKKKLSDFKLICEILNKKIEEPFDILTYSYEVSETSIGTVVYAICNEFNARDNITDYDCW